MLELFYNFFTKVCDETKFEELEKDTDSLYPALVRKKLEDYFILEMRAALQKLQSKDCVQKFTADAVANSPPPPEQGVQNTNNIIKENLGSSKKSSDVGRCYVYARTSPLRNLTLAVKVSTNVYWDKVATDHRKRIVES